MWKVFEDVIESFLYQLNCSAGAETAAKGHTGEAEDAQRVNEDRPTSFVTGDFPTCLTKSTTHLKFISWYFKKE